jgi:hypothetical protein
MYECFITFRSITAAQRGEYVLRQVGIRAALVRTPKTISRNGCGYSLQVSDAYCVQAVQELRMQGAAVGKIYRQGPEGLQEVAL